MPAPILRKARTFSRILFEEMTYTWRADSLRPDFFVIGGQKCGTTALAHFLTKHPDVVGVKDKEAHFFHRDAVHARGQAWYARQFPARAAYRSGVRLFDATPCYMYHPGTAERIRKYCPEARMLVMLRNPVPRAWSAYVMVRHVRKNYREHVMRKILLNANPEQRDPMVRFYFRETFPSFGQAIDEEIESIRNGDPNLLETSFVRRGLFARQLEEYFKVFPRERIKIIEDKELRNHREKVMGEVGEFLGLRPIAWNATELEDKNVRTYDERPDPEVVARLYEFFRPYNEQLFELLGRRYDWEPKEKLRAES
jgi:hypothetical protein